MKFIRDCGKKLLVFMAISFFALALSYIRTVFVLPKELTLLEGEEYVFNFKSPFLVRVTADKVGVLKLNDQDMAQNGISLRLSDSFSFKSLKTGSVILSMKVFGLLPLRVIHVDVMPKKEVAVCGNTVGVKLQIDGILVIGMSDVETVEGRRLAPAKQAGIRTGDIITEVNNHKADGISVLMREIENSGGKPVKIRYKRGGTVGSAEVRPVKSVENMKYRIGLWVRDSAAGIGTLTYVDPETGDFGALGHGITDADTGVLIPIRGGEVIRSRVIDIRKGRQGVPGELKGVFSENGTSVVGNIEKNTEQGIYGKIDGRALVNMPLKTYPITVKSHVKEGPATILANIRGDRVEEYRIQIQKVFHLNDDNSRGMVIKVVDPRLLEETGGIVQGMSGSPIIQNGRIVGAVTHVLVNDPTRGYGIFIEKMLKNSGNTEEYFLKLAG